MVVPIGRFSYAKQRLREQGLRIVELEDASQIADYHWYSETEIPVIRPHFFLDKTLKKKRDVQPVYDYEKLNELGFGIVVRPGAVRVRGRRRDLYEVVSLTNNSRQEYGIIPAGHQIHYDSVGRCSRILGPNASKDQGTTSGPWVFRNPHTRELDGLSREERLHREARKIVQRREMFSEEEIPTRVELRHGEIPVLYNDTKIVCIDVMNTHNECVYGVSGERGYGKTTFLVAFPGRCHHYGGKAVINLNDRTGESRVNALPADPDSKFGLKLGILNEVPHQMLVVCLHLGSPSKVLNRNESGFSISLSYRVFNREIETYVAGSRQWRLDKSLRFLKEILFDGEDVNDDLLSISSLEQFGEYVDYRKNIPGQSKQKIKDVMADIFRSKLLDVSTDHDVRSAWHLVDASGKEVKNSPWVACLRARLMPINVTMSYTDKHYFPQVLAILADDILDKQTNDDWFEKNKLRMLVVMDELENTLYSREAAKRRQRTVAASRIIRFATEGRPKRIGTIWATQNFFLVPEELLSQTQFFFSFNQKGGNSKAIVAEYLKGEDSKTQKDMRKTLEDLDEHEVVAFTSKHFVTYDRATCRRDELSTPQRGFTFPPLNQHMPPYDGPEIGRAHV